MKTEDIISEIISDLSDSSLDSNLLPIITKRINSYGAENFLFGTALYHDLQSYPDICIQTNYSEIWQKRYNEKDYFNIDLTVAHCKEKNTPVVWPTDSNEISKENKKLFSEASNFGITSGISFPCHSSGSGYGALAVSTSEQYQQSELSKPENLFSLHLLSSTLFDLIRFKCKKESIIKLTEREKECLKWVAAGKTSWEISMILGISERTVVFHLQNTASKMNATTRTSSVVTAILNGEITI